MWYCEHPGCGNEANVWRIPHDDTEAIFYLCDTHAAQYGFCLYCGAFVGGTEDSALVGQEGLCFECYMDLDREARADTDQFEYREAYDE